MARPPASTEGSRPDVAAASCLAPGASPAAFHPEQLWAKWGQGGQWRYPLLAHLLDTAITCGLIMDRMPSGVNDWLSQQIMSPGVNDALSQQIMSSADLKTLLMRAGGLHDCGKCNPVFQAQLLSRQAMSFEPLARDLQQGGIWVPDTRRCLLRTDASYSFIRRHEVASAVCLEGSAEGHSTPAALSLIVSGHHGRWNVYTPNAANTALDAMDFYRRWLADPGWHRLRSALRKDLDAVVPAHLDGVRVPIATIPILTAVVTLADWLASTERSLSHGQQQLQLLSDPAQFAAAREGWLRPFVEETLGTLHPPQGSFEQVFGFAPNTMQQRASLASGPGLSIISAPMGKGKTEAALGRWLLHGRGRGLFFALPTMATADAMMDRMRAFFASSPEQTAATVSHSQAILNNFYDFPGFSALPGQQISVVPGETDEERQGLTPASWFNGTHRSLLAPVSVGTIDQLLSGMLRHRFNYMRLLGVLSKTVILDEVHSYDPYADELLTQYLRWAGYLGIDTVLLSATLPRRRLRAYVKAYSGSDITALPTYPYVLHVGVGQQRPITIASVRDRSCSSQIDVRYLHSIEPKELSEQATALQEQYPTAKIGIILNQIGLVQDTASLLLGSLVLHSRMTAEHKSRIVQAAIAGFGRQSVEGGSTLVATQIVEQSIDLDFDILISEVAPGASLIQRVGRLWRHPSRSQRQRPPGLTAPLLVLAVPPRLVDAQSSKRDMLPYSPAEMQRTWDTALAAGSRTKIAIPEDIEPFVEKSDISWEQVKHTSEVEQHLTQEAVRSGMAKQAEVIEPAQLQSAVRLERFAGEQPLSNEEWATRWINGPTASILPLSSTGGYAFLRTDLPESASPSRALIKQILAKTIPVSGHLVQRLYGEKKVRPLREVYPNSALLGDILCVDVDALEYLEIDPRLGLIYHRSA